MCLGRVRDAHPDRVDDHRVTVAPGGCRGAERVADRGGLGMTVLDMPDVKYTATYWDASLHDPERLAIDVPEEHLGAMGCADANHGRKNTAAV